MKKAAGWGAILVFWALFLEVASFLVLTFVPHFQSFIYREADVTQEKYEHYLQDRHPVLGWPTKGWLAEKADEKGARLSPANEALGAQAAPCMSVYGDSFAYSAEVEHKDAWANALAESLGCRVNNYGIGGFGSDQAVLRFEQHLSEGRDLGDTIILTIYPDNLNRHANQWRRLFGGSPFTFKPAFRVTDNGDIVKEPLFSGDYETFKALIADPAEYLKAEQYLPDSQGFRRMQRMKFPYTISAVKVVLGQIRTFRGFGTSGMANFYNFPAYYDDRNGPSAEKKAVTTYIIRKFASLCEEYGKRCAFVVTPDPELVLQVIENGEHDLRGLLEGAAEGLIFLDATEMFDDLADVCAHVTNPEKCGGHYNAAGYARLAKFVENGLKASAD